MLATQAGQGPVGMLAQLITDSRRAVSPCVTHHGVWLELWCWGHGKGCPRTAEPRGSSPATPRSSPMGCAGRDGVLGAQPCTPRTCAHTEAGHRQTRDSLWADGSLAGGEGVSASSLAQIDRQTEGMIHVSGCGPRAETGEMFDVKMPAGLCGSFPSLSQLCPCCPGIPAWPGGRKQLKQHGMRPMH